MKAFLILCLSIIFCSNITAFTAPSITSCNSNSVRIQQPSITVTPLAFVTHHSQGIRTSSPTSLFGKKEARAKGNERKNKRERVKKVKDDVIEVEAIVVDSLPNAMFRCKIDGAPETQPLILSTISGKIRKNFVKILVGDRVLIELSPYDLTRGRITFRNR